MDEEQEKSSLTYIKTLMAIDNWVRQMLSIKMGKGSRYPDGPWGHHVM